MTVSFDTENIKEVEIVKMLIEKYKIGKKEENKENEKDTEKENININEVSEINKNLQEKEESHLAKESTNTNEEEKEKVNGGVLDFYEEARKIIVEIATSGDNKKLERVQEVLNENGASKLSLIQDENLKAVYERVKEIYEY